jgi:proteic killer suppression protein
MITSFGDKSTQKIWQGDRVVSYSTELQETARRKLRMLNNSHDLNDLMVPPSNRLEKLKGNWKEYYSIRVNGNGEFYFDGIMEMLTK